MRAALQTINDKTLEWKIKPAHERLTSIAELARGA
jgi:hypothetical protein